MPGAGKHGRSGAKLLVDGQGHKVTCTSKNGDEDDHVIGRLGKTSGEVKGNVGPRTAWGGKWSELSARGNLEDLLNAQMMQADRYSGTSFINDGHQSLLCGRLRVPFIPRWHVNLAVWAQWLTWETKKEPAPKGDDEGWMIPAASESVTHLSMGSHSGLDRL